MKLIRYSKNPILKPTKNWWEEKAVFNPGATIFRDKIYLLYRAVGDDNLSRLGLAHSQDGLKFTRVDEPLLEGVADSPFERLGIEDPRISKIGDTYYLVYTAASVYPATEVKEHAFARSLNHPLVPYRVRISLITTKNFQTFYHHGVLIDDFDSKDGALLPEKLKGFYFLFHRHLPSIWLSYSTTLKDWRRGKELVRPKESWEKEKIGIGAPPLKTEFGWLIFYHGVDANHTYRLGAMLFDHDNPTQLLKKTREPLLEPQKVFEKEGNVKEVVFTCGAVEKDDKYYLYYGGGDKVIGLAKIGKKQLLHFLLHN